MNENGMDLDTFNEMASKGSVEEPKISDKEESEVKQLMDLFYIYKRYRCRYDKKFMDYYRLVRGNQWDSRRPTWKNSEVINFIFATIQSQIPLQTDVRPRFSFLPTEPTDREFAEILDQLSESDSERYGWLRTVFEVLFDGWIYGTGIGCMKYDQSVDNGLGGAVFKSVDPLYCYPHPDANTINDPDSKTFIYAQPEETTALKHEFPDKAKFLKADITDKIRKDKTDLNKYTTSAYFNSDLNLPMGDGEYNNESNATLDDVPRTMVFRFYMRPKDVVETENKSVDDVTGEEKTEYEVNRKHPNGRYVVIANKMILYDGELPYEDLKIPYAKYNNYIMPREFWGVSECEQLASPQAIFNKILCFSLDSLAMMGNPIWVVDSNSEVDSDNLSNTPGGVVEKNPGTEVRREAGVGIAPTAFQMLNSLEGWFNTVAGNSEFSEGSTGGGVTAASAIEQLIRESRTRIRQKQRNLNEFMNEAGTLYMSRVFQYYSIPKIYRLTNSDGTQTFRKARIETNEAGKKVAVINDFQENEANQMIELPERKLELKGQFDVRVTTDSELPFDVADDERKVLALFDRGIVDEEEVLNKISYPNREKVLDRLQKRKEAEAQAMAQQEQQKGG